MWIIGLNVALNMILIRGLGPIPGFGAQGAALGTSIASFAASGVGIWLMATGRVVVRFSRGMPRGPDWTIIRSLFRFGLPAGVQGVAMNVAGVLLLRFMGSLPYSAEAQAAYAVGYTELFSFITWTSVGLMGAAAAIAGQNLGAGHPERSVQAVQVAARFGLMIAGTIGVIFLLVRRSALGLLRPDRSHRAHARAPAAPLPERLGPLHHRGADLYRRPAGDGRHAQPALHHAGRRRFGVPLGLCFYLEATGRLEASGIWLAIVLGHFTRALLSAWVFQRGRWRTISVDVPRDRRG